MSSAPQLARTGRFETMVSGVTALSPRMRRIALRAPAIAHQEWPLGCDVAVVLRGEDGRELRRRYTVRSVAGTELLIDAVLHGHGPGSAWAEAVRVGDPVVLVGPRGSIDISPRAAVLALTDESGLPAIAALAEASSAVRTFRVLAEVAGPAEIYPLPPGVDVDWLSRGDHPAGTPNLLSAAVQRLAVGPEPRPRWDFAYVLGESRTVVELREQLGAVGLGRPQVYAKGYWNLNSRATR